MSTGGRCGAKAMIGAMKNVDSFAGQSAFKTWVFAILRNKIRDILRKRQRLVTANSLLSLMRKTMIRMWMPCLINVDIGIARIDR